MLTLLPTLVTSTTQLVTKVPAPMMLVSSTALMFHYRWSEQWVRTPSSPRLASRPDMVWLLTHSQKVQQEDLADLPLTPTATTEELQLRTSCEPLCWSHTEERVLRDSLFLSKYLRRPAFYYGILYN